MISDNKILVTGGAGFIGSNLCAKLKDFGNDVIAVDNLSVSDANVKYLEGLGVTLHVKDIVELNDINPLFEGVDFVVHLAAMNRAQRSIEDPIAANKVNIDGTLNCLEAARQNRVKRFVNVSSSSVYANQRENLLVEDMPLAPPHPYGVGKLAGEHYSRVYRELYGLDTVSLRFFSVYGPRQLGTIDKAGVVAKFIHQSMSDEPLTIYGSGDQMRNFSYVDDVNEYVVRSLVAENVVGEVINIANPREVDVNYLASVVKEVTKKNIEIKHLEPLKGDPNRNPADTSKCIRLLKYQPVFTFEQGIESTYRWYQQKEI